MQHDTKHTTRWPNGTNFFFTTNVVRCCMKTWDRLTGALEMTDQGTLTFMWILPRSFAMLIFVFGKI